MDLATLQLKVDAAGAIRATEQLTGALEKNAMAGTRVEQASARTTRSLVAAGAATRAQALNAELAARRTASFATALATTGTVSARTGGQILGAATAIGTGFGPGGIAALAIVAFASKFIGEMGRVREEAELTAKKWEDSIRRMVNAGDIAEMTKMAQDLFLGTPYEKFKDGIVEAQRVVDAFKRNNETVPGQLSNLFNADEIEKAEKHLAGLRVKYDELVARIDDTKNRPFRSLTVDPIRIDANRRAEADALAARKAEWEQSKLFADERAGWEHEERQRKHAAIADEVKLRTEFERTGKVLQANAKAAHAWRMEMPSVTGIQNGQQVTYRPGQGVMAIPGNIGSGDLRNPAPKWLADMTAGNKQIAENFTENLQRAGGDIFASFVTQGEVSVRSVFGTFRDIGGQLIGQTFAKALGEMKLSTGESMGLGIGLGVVGSVVTSFIDGQRQFRQEIEATRLAFVDLHRSLDEWIIDAVMWDATPEEKERRRLTLDADERARDAWKLYEKAPGDYMKGLTGNAERDRAAIQARLDAAGGDWSKVLPGHGIGQTPVKFLKEYLDALNKVAEGTQAHTDAINQQAEAEEQAKIRAKAAERAASLFRTVEGLQGFSRDLRQSNLSIYNPFQQQDDARTRYELLVTNARAGDQSAADQLPAAARAYLESSRAINASGSRYTADFLKVERDTAEITARYKDELGVQERIATGTELLLDVLTRHEPYLEAQINGQQAQTTVLQSGFAVLQDIQTQQLASSRSVERRLILLEEALAA